MIIPKPKHFEIKEWITTQISGNNENVFFFIYDDDDDENKNENKNDNDVGDIEDNNDKYGKKGHCILTDLEKKWIFDDFESKWKRMQKKLYGIQILRMEHNAVKEIRNRPRIILKPLLETDEQDTSTTFNSELSRKYFYQVTNTSNEPLRILITYNEPIAAFHACQSLLQLLFTGLEEIDGSSYRIPVFDVTEDEKPRYDWRGMNMDCCRHFFHKEFVKKYLDILSFYKMNRFHWHLTEDQGWRIQIRKYPKLTKISSFRCLREDEKSIIHTNADHSLYGGFFSQEDIKEVVSYARSKFITIIPEIELPGHSVAALAAYPEFSCTGGPFNVTNEWGVFDDVYCAGNDKTFHFLEDVFEEIFKMFPYSKYVHIGGDECPKKRWEQCPKCQKRIKDEGLKNEHELQSYFIKRIEAFITSKGRTVIGWDEIVEGGLPKNTIVQSWRGLNGAATAILSGQDTIVSPTSHTYFDYPVESTDLNKVYSFDPGNVPLQTSPSDTKRGKVLGSEFNMWTERIQNEQKFHQMAFPRCLALAEVLYSNAPKRNYREFFDRVKIHEKLTATLFQVTFGDYCHPLVMKTITQWTKQGFKSIEVAMELNEKEKEHISKESISYKYDFLEGGDKDPSTEYCAPIPLQKKVCSIVGQAFLDGEKYGLKYIQNFVVTTITGNPIFVKQDPSFLYPGLHRHQNLLDGIWGTMNHKDSAWQGFLGTDIDICIDMRPSMKDKVSSIGIRFLHKSHSWIFLPVHVDFFSIQNSLINQDEHINLEEFMQNNSFEFLHRAEHQISPISDKLEIYHFQTPEKLASKISTSQFIKLHIQSIKTCPPGHPGSGQKSWLFCDQIISKP